MPIGHTETQPDKSPNTSPVQTFHIKITQRDLDEIHHLVKRSYAGLTVAWLPAMIAITKILDQISKQDEELDNYDSDGTKPEDHVPEHEDVY
jgi:hypothetical protein